MAVGTKLFNNCRIIAPQGIIENGSVLVQDGTIISIIRKLEDYDIGAFTEVIDVEGMLLAPGFIDVHVHGGGGHDVMSGTAEALEGLSCYAASKGVTSLLATTLTSNRLSLERVVTEISSAMDRGTSGAEIVGIHLEGPFLNTIRCGAQKPEHIRRGTIEELQAYIDLSHNRIKLMTIAPEMDEHLELIRYAYRNQITVSIGHSDASYEDVMKAVENGATHVTHLFNGMRPMHHREPGVVGAALLDDRLAVELICDGIHVHKDLISLVFRSKPPDKVILVTDAMCAAGCVDGHYMLGDLPVVLHNGSVRLMKDNSLAGSVLSMDQALRNVIDFTGKSLEYVIQAMTINPAKQIGITDKKGSIEIGKDADFVILDKELTVSATFVRGLCVYPRMEAKI